MRHLVASTVFAAVGAAAVSVAQAGELWRATGFEQPESALVDAMPSGRGGTAPPRPASGPFDGAGCDGPVPPRKPGSGGKVRSVMFAGAPPAAPPILRKR